jgi:hypothetical protein
VSVKVDNRAILQKVNKATISYYAMRTYLTAIYSAFHFIHIAFLHSAI